MFYDERKIESYYVWIQSVTLIDPRFYNWFCEALRPRLFPLDICKD
ncbi:hypothetical protein SAMN06269173_11274 [Hymenobacter mucosus]|uniref:Uncharacterized protein n=1 Tax=Hymenobacter mucosus TaxID=1411120 RepID=A0A239AH91_9BACT|nr:hypothetical protein SAMN06269173_11274 [Hymenobacter mucosus]